MLPPRQKTILDSSFLYEETQIQMILDAKLKEDGLEYYKSVEGEITGFLRKKGDGKIHRDETEKMVAILGSLADTTRVGVNGISALLEPQLKYWQKLIDKGENPSAKFLFSYNPGGHWYAGQILITHHSDKEPNDYNVDIMIYNPTGVPSRLPDSVIGEITRVFQTNGATNGKKFSVSCNLPQRIQSVQTGAGCGIYARIGISNLVHHTYEKIWNGIFTGISFAGPPRRKSEEQLRLEDLNLVKKWTEEEARVLGSTTLVTEVLTRLNAETRPKSAAEIAAITREHSLATEPERIHKTRGMLSLLNTMLDGNKKLTQELLNIISADQADMRTIYESLRDFIRKNQEFKVLLQNEDWMDGGLILTNDYFKDVIRCFAPLATSGTKISVDDYMAQYYHTTPSPAPVIPLPLDTEILRTTRIDHAKAIKYYFVGQKEKRFIFRLRNISDESTDSDFSLLQGSSKISDDDNITSDNVSSTVMLGLENACSKYGFGPKEVAIIILIAIKNGGLASANADDLERDFGNAFARAGLRLRADAAYLKRVKGFSADFQQAMEGEGIYTGNPNPKKLVGMRLKRLTTDHAAVYCQDSRFVRDVDAAINPDLPHPSATHPRVAITERPLQHDPVSRG